jgi:Tfp pilus assembly protein PilV
MLVAIMLFTIGLLAMAGTASLVTVALAGSRTRSVAAAVAESRFDWLRAQTCSAHTGGTAVTRGVREDWRVQPLARADDVTVVVTIVSNRRTRTQSFSTYIPC